MYILPNSEYICIDQLHRNKAAMLYILDYRERLISKLFQVFIVVRYSVY